MILKIIQLSKRILKTSWADMTAMLILNGYFYFASAQMGPTFRFIQVSDGLVVEVSLSFILETFQLKYPY